MSPQYVLACDISPQHTRKAIRLRLVRAYETPEFRGSNVCRTLECLFHDVEGTYVHVIVPKEQVDKYRSTLKEGGVYGIKNFLVITNYYRFKTTELRYMMKFNYSTILKEYKRKVFPRLMFRLTSIESLKSTTEVNEYLLIDVIGRVVEIYSPLEKFVEGRKARLIDFVIEDGNGSRLKCTVWDEHVDTVLPYFNAVIEGPLILLIQLCRPKSVDGEVRISSSYNATKLWFNHDTPEFIAFKQSLKEQCTPLRSISSSSRLSNNTAADEIHNGNIVLSSIDQLYGRQQLGDFWVAAKIVGIESVKDWFYRSCRTNGCNKKLVQIDGGFMECPNCKCKWGDGLLKYRLIVRVVGVNGNAPFLLWDRECTELLGITALELYTRLDGVNMGIPRELENLCGKRGVFKVVVKTEQLEMKTSAFTVMRVLTDTTLVEKYCVGFEDENVSDNSNEEDGASRLGGNFELDSSSDEEGDNPIHLRDGSVGPGSSVSGSVKRRLLGDFEAIKATKKGKGVVVKKEKM